MKYDVIDADLHSRGLQWSFRGEPAPCLASESAAYRFAGFGTHEVVVYYELMRLLLSECHATSRRAWVRERGRRDLTVISMSCPRSISG
jgi:hypothetical protein